MDKKVPDWLADLGVRSHISAIDQLIALAYWPEKNQTRKYVVKSWGNEDWIINTPLFCGKILTIDPGKSTSWHYHEKKEECFYVIEGTMNLFYDWNKIWWKAKNVMLEKFDSFHIPVGMVHQLCCHANERLRILEISTHHEDSDSIRLKDDGTLL